MKKLFLVVLLLLTTPVLANAWYVNAKTSPTTGAGTISPAGTVTVPAGSNSGEYTVTPAAGYNVSRVTLDGVAVAPNANGKYVAPYVAAYTYRYFVAYFAAASYNISVSATGNGAIIEANGQSLTGIPGGSARTLTVLPSAGYYISSLSASGYPLIVTNADGSRTVSYSNLQASQTVSATFTLIPVVTASAGNDVSTTGTGVQYAATLYGTGTSNQGAMTYSWSGPGLTFGTPNAASTTVYSNSVGDYTATLTVTSNGLASMDSAVVHVVTHNSYQNSLCVGCHSQNMPALVDKYNSSPHATTNPCQGCHTDQPHYALPDPNICATCHDTSSHPFEITNTCTYCHDPHTTKSGAVAAPTGAHYNNISTGTYPASYVTSRITCAYCHNTAANNKAIRMQWEIAGHADINGSWKQRDFKTLSGCAQCHSTTGFIAYSSGKNTAAWGDAADKTKEVLVCSGCHKDILTGELRTVSRIAPYPNDTYVTPDFGRSTVCLQCHIGTANGKSITARYNEHADFASLPFISPHFFAAGGTLNGVAGYHFPGRSYISEASHRAIGNTEGDGACVTCHRNNITGHTFRGLAQPFCANCHGSVMDAAFIASEKSSYTNVLEVLRAQLAANGFVYDATSKGFNNTNWGSGLAGANTMGAAFNYVLFTTDTGGFVHHPTYSKQLILDSIDYLDNGVIDDSVTTIAIPNLLASGAISQAVADGLTTYRSKNNCTVCHGYTPNSGAPMATNGHDTHMSTAYGPGSYLGTDLDLCQGCHVYSAATHANHAVDLKAAACTGCHPGGAPSWNNSARLDCTSCHAQTASVLPNGVAAPYKANFFNTGHGRYTYSNQCTNCHDANARHISGALGDDVRLSLPNDNNLCASCHNDPNKVGEALIDMVTHHSLDCRSCHDVHGTTNRSMIRATIKGSTITFTDRSYGLIDTVTNRGLCQVCHTTTVHYRAGVQERNHFTSGCFNCHTHYNPAGAFKPAGGGCNSCHGYPPAPKNTSTPFGTENNWADSRFEDYSGGGGGHLVVMHLSPLAKAIEGFSNCTPCHNNAESSHNAVTPVQDHISDVTVVVDRSLRFAEGFTVYTGAKQFNPPAVNSTGKCFNISCHMSASPRWSTER